ncbi:hypothetical protein [Paenibacillus gansuensis]|uniref:NIPSNAP domain-containing protein n=1 Tax=Paenibacillus gansuensis TaxID=306542 RepID=A0ABW5PGM9_9BACL
MRIKIFAEYRIKRECRSAYLEWAVKAVESMSGSGVSLEILEGFDQPLLFVELWIGVTEADYRKLKGEREDESHPLWGQLPQYIEGGSAKFHMWAFTKTAPLPE